MKFLAKPGLVFFIAIPVFILVGMMALEELAAINIHDTYYVVERGFLLQLLSLGLFLAGMAYRFLRKTSRSLSGWFNQLHTIVTLGGIFLILLLSKMYRDRGAETLMADTGYNHTLTTWIFVITLVITGAQLAFVVGIMGRLFNRRS